MENESHADKAHRSRGIQNRLLRSEAFKLYDWIRVPGQIEGLKTYKEIAEKAGRDGVIGREPATRTIEDMMEDAGLSLPKPPAAPRDKDIAALANAFINLCMTVGEEECITDEIKQMAGR